MGPLEGGKELLFIAVACVSAVANDGETVKGGKQ